jgi:hypothetical protein
MKFYPLLLGALLLQAFVFMPPYEVMRWYHRPDDGVFSILDAGGIGPYVHVLHPTNVQFDGPDYSGQELDYISVYVGNVILSLVLAFVVVAVWRIEREG